MEQPTSFGGWSEYSCLAEWADSQKHLLETINRIKGGENVCYIYPACLNVTGNETKIHICGAIAHESLEFNPTTRELLLTGVGKPFDFDSATIRFEWDRMEFVRVGRWRGTISTSFPGNPSSDSGCGCIAWKAYHCEPHPICDCAEECRAKYSPGFGNLLYPPVPAPSPMNYAESSPMVSCVDS